MANDGDRRAQLLLGVPIMMEYDGPTGAWKLVVDTELDTVIIVSGTVALEPGDLEIGAVEIKDAFTDDRQRVTADGRAWVNALITGTVTVSDLSVPDDEVTAYVTGSVGLVLAPTIERDIINITGSAAAEYMLATGVAGQQIKVMEVMLSSSNLQNVRFLSGWSGTALSGPLHLANSGEGFFVGTPDGKDAYHFETLSGQILVLDTDAGGQLGGWLNYYVEE